MCYLVLVFARTRNPLVIIGSHMFSRREIVSKNVFDQHDFINKTKGNFYYNDNSAIFLPILYLLFINFSIFLFSRVCTLQSH